VYYILEYTIYYSILYITVYYILQYTIYYSILYITVYYILQYTIYYSVLYILHFKLVEFKLCVHLSQVLTSFYCACLYYWFLGTSCCIYFDIPDCDCGNSLFFDWNFINPLNPELNPICYLLALLGAHHFLHVSRIMVKSLPLRLLLSYIYGAHILDVSRSHTTTHHSW